MPLPALLITFQFHLVVTFLYMEAQWPCSLLNTADNLFGWLLTCEPRLLFLRALQNQLRNIKTIATVKDFTQSHIKVINLVPCMTWLFNLAPLQWLEMPFEYSLRSVRMVPGESQKGQTDWDHVKEKWAQTHSLPLASFLSFLWPCVPASHNQNRV